ncbi:galactose 1-dehydrogenase [Tistlia consotensis]|uniref:Galactose 1-dehydrogenase n=1 Tax=Tistlia consotensis USBA 355 TaxID=560819 RepID=A0A1Y6CP67_9PROT|nr:Gfo/Idh/MocA family oxidoreductase [Tistlia consotensis]SMF78312.1 galactose 1-dehydrogenase [Tistlia consotensis USBA 355]SNS18285.1 galactose 1-dehydrogenase [Tistlia consotensis]
MAAAQRHRLAVAGLGKIARDQHLPALARSEAFELAATADPAGGLPEVDHFDALERLLAERPDVTALSLCTPPQVRYPLARAALQAGRHLLLEKPPGQTLGEVEALRALAEAAGVSLFATWHSRFAPAVPRARDWVAGHRVERVRIAWKEDVRRWHPGQRWIWQPGGFGVFDPGINALSILTAVLPRPLRVVSATLEVPENCAAPIAARLSMTDDAGVAIEAELDFRQEGPQTWDMAFEGPEGAITLQAGGSRLSLDPPEGAPAMIGEYDAIYRRFAELIGRGESEVDVAPLRLVADAFLVGRSRPTEAFHD